MASAPRVDSSTRRRLIIDAAAQLFIRRPFNEVTTRALAEAAGVSEALIFQHFGSKQGLYLAVVQAGIEDVTASLHDVVTAAAELPEATVERLEEIFAGALDFWFADPRFVHSFLTEPNAEDARRSYYQVLLDHEEKLLPTLEAARRQGMLPDVDPRVLVRALIGQTLVFLVTEEWLGGKDLGPLDRTTLPGELARLWAGILGATPATGRSRPGRTGKGTAG